MSLYKRLLTQLAGKMGPVLRVAYMDVGKQRENGYGSFAPEKAPLSVVRCLFGTTKLRASRLAYRDVGKGREQGGGSFDWHFFWGNSNNLISVNRP